jgi:C_GCAxxG_C_C family probable redox protein
MKNLQDHPKTICTNKCNRRSFITKSVYSTIGVSLISGLSTSAIASYIRLDKSKEEIYKQLDELVDKYFPIYGTCSQASCAALTETFDIEADQVVKALAPFPGIALRGETCGAVSGCLAAIALAYEEDILKDKEKQGLSREPAFTFCSKFVNEYGSTRCRDVIAHLTNKKYELSKPEDYAKLGEEGAYANCPGMVKQAVHFAAEIILEKS